MKNSIKSLFVTALMLPAFGVFSSAFAYEMVEAETVFPKAKDNQNAPQLSAGVEKKEFTIPNPLDELTLRRIREAEKAIIITFSKQNAPEKSAFSYSFLATVSLNKRPQITQIHVEMIGNAILPNIGIHLFTGLTKITSKVSADISSASVQ